MSDIINLLPDSIANQIAAGEVIQRPASVVKELMENSVDADSTEIMLVIKEAGKVLIQVVDNGNGMSETDARMCFERHATSKIQSANDIFKIKTKGFRGEALASIAAISHVELATCQLNCDIGSKVLIYGSKFKSQTPIQSKQGTKISVKNLFFNVPARRKFLKSDAIELKHITDEFIRIALSHVDLAFSFYHNGKELYRLPISNLKQRIVNIFGRGFESKLLPLDEQMEILKIGGFIGKISASRKSRSNQFIFVNNRFIRSPYLNHAISASYEEYLSDGQHPVYFLYLDIDPDKIDINIHPTKQEIKFEDERLIYNYIRVAIKHVLGKFTYTPSLDFNSDETFNSLSYKNKPDSNKQFNKNSSYPDPIQPNRNKDEWEKAFEILNDDKPSDDSLISTQEIPSSLNSGDKLNSDSNTFSEGNVFQLHNSYIIKQVKSGFILIDQKYAHERILYEEYLRNYNSSESLSLEQLMFPKLLTIEKSKIAILKDFKEDLIKFGFLLEENDKSEFLIKALPANINDKKGISQLIENIIDDYVDAVEVKIPFKDNFSRSLAKANARNRGSHLTVDEMNHLIDNLFKCENPYTTPSGKKCFIIIEMNEILKRFGR